MAAACRGPTAPLEPTLISIQRNVFDVHCVRAGCHAGGAPESQPNLEAGRSYAGLVDRPSVGIPSLLRVDPGRPEQSYLMRKLSGEGIVGERMPMGAPPLPDSVTAVIRRWIAAGAPAD